MARFQKGHEKIGGRQKGIKDRADQIGRETIMDLIVKLRDGIDDDFRRLQPRDRVRFYIELLKFVVPLRQETVVESRSYNEELRALCESYESGDPAPGGAED